MAYTSTQFLSAVLLVSDDADRLAAFYRDVIGIPLDVEQHDDSVKHYGCELGDIHFAIHPPDNVIASPTREQTIPAVHAVKLAFEIFDMDGFLAHLRKFDIALLYPPKQLGTSLITALVDPDGNEIEFTQLSGSWFEHLKKRREQGHDIVHRWNEFRANK